MNEQKLNQLKSLLLEYMLYKASNHDSNDQLVNTFAVIFHSISKDQILKQDLKSK